MAVKLSVTGLAPHVCAGFSIFEGHEGEDASSLGVYEGAVEQQPLDHVQRWDCSCTDDCCTHAQSLNVGGVKLNDYTMCRGRSGWCSDACLFACTEG